MLGLAGLSEARLYLRPFSQLSAGQQYRAMLAALMWSGANVWIADEFMSALDPLSAAAVASKIAKVVRAQRIALVVAAPHSHLFLEDLRPDMVIRLSVTGGHRIERPARAG